MQNAVAAQGYPAPRAPLASADPGPLGGAFVVMERLPGRPLLETRRVGIASRLADWQARLHALAAEPVLAAAESAGLDRSTLTFEGYLDQLDARIRRHGLDGLRQAMAWLRDHRPATARAVVCHGDFHPQNLLAEGARITGILDWPNTVVADPAFDIASTRLILACVPLELMGTPAPLRPVIALARRVLLGAYLYRWRRLGLPDAERLAYHEAAASMRLLVRAAEARSGRTGEAAPGRLEASTFPERLAARFTRATGVRPIIA